MLRWKKQVNMYLRTYLSTHRCKVLFSTKLSMFTEACTPENFTLRPNKLETTRKEYFSDFKIRDEIVFKNKNQQISRSSCNLSGSKCKKPNRKPRNPFTRVSLSLYQIRLAVAAILIAALGVFYYKRLVVDPISSRKKLLLLTDKQTMKLGKIQSDYYKRKYEDKIATSGDQHARATKVVNKLVERNAHLPGVETDSRSWSVYVINEAVAVKSYVMANGDIFVSSALLEAVDDDHLAALIAHQVAHVLLNHSSEMTAGKRALTFISLNIILLLTDLAPEFFCDTVYPILSKLSVSALKSYMSQKLEEEADSLGLEIFSNACFDPRKIGEFWEAMEALGMKNVRLLWQHPLDISRYNLFRGMLPKAIDILSENVSEEEHPFNKKRLDDKRDRDERGF